MLSPQQAANRAKVSRRTIMVAIEQNKLHARRNNRNNWLIEPSDLDAWMAGRDTPTSSPSGTTSEGINDTYHEHSITIARLEEKLTAAEDRAETLETTLSEERNNHSDLVAELKASHIEQMTRRDRDYREAMELLREAQKPRGLLDWLGIRKDPKE